MIHEKTISTPANTAITSKVKTHWKIEAGIIQELMILFPPGCVGLLNLQIKYEGHQVFPKSTGQFRGNNDLFVFRNVMIPIFIPPYELVCYTWNTDTLFSHDVDIYVNISSSFRFIE